MSVVLRALYWPAGNVRAVHHARSRGRGAFASGNDHFLNGANLAISVVTLLLLPILQATQNRDGAALHAKLDELIKSNADARDALIGLESKGEQEIERYVRISPMTKLSRREPRRLMGDKAGQGKACAATAGA